MSVRTPITLITGPLGSGKTTLLRHILDRVPGRLALLMNEFGEIAIDSRIIEGKNIRVAELDGGCVCCSLLGEFEAAITEILERVDPELIVVETTGVAEPDALVFDIQDSLPRIRLDGVVAVADADGLVRFPELGHTGRMQIEAADMILLNKVDLVSPEEQTRARDKLTRLNPEAAVLTTRYCRVSPDLLFGIGRERDPRPARHLHQPDFDAFDYVTDASLDRGRFERLADGLGTAVFRAKGFVRFPEGTSLFNYVAGRWALEPFRPEKTALVFIGPSLGEAKAEILRGLKACEL